MFGYMRVGKHFCCVVCVRFQCFGFDLLLLPFACRCYNSKKMAAWKASSSFCNTGFAVCAPGFFVFVLCWQSCVGIRPTKSGNLDGWCKQGVLLLNSVLSVERSKAFSHRKQGYENRPYENKPLRLGVHFFIYLSRKRLWYCCIKKNGKWRLSCDIITHYFARMGFASCVELHFL